MNAGLLPQKSARTYHAPREANVLLVVPNQAARYILAEALLDSGFRLTLASSYGLADLLVSEAGLDLLVTTQKLDDMGTFGLPDLARAVRPDLPILVLEEETAGGPGVLDAIHRILRRWPVRDWAAPLLQ